METLSVLPTLDWAADIAKRDDVAAVSGFHSMMEREVLGLPRSISAGSEMSISTQYHLDSAGAGMI